MKRILALMLTAVICLSLCACGSAKFTEDELVEALSTVDGTLDAENSGGKVKSFTYIMEDVNAEKLSDRDYVYEAFVQFTDDYTQATLAQYKVSCALYAVMAIDTLLAGDKGTADLDEYLDIVCDGKTLSRGGWTVTAVVDVDADSMTITGKQG